MLSSADRAQARRRFVGPIMVATILTFGGEMLIFLVWELRLFPGGNLLSKLVWTTTCGIAMGATIGALAILVVTDRLMGRVATAVAGSISFVVLALCTILYYRIELTLGLFGAEPAPTLFIAGGIIPALFGSALYGWLLHSRIGTSLLARVNL